LEWKGNPKWLVEILLLTHLLYINVCPQKAFQTAVALALYDASGDKETPVIRESHLQQVVSMSRAFKEYLKHTHDDMDESEMAYRSGLRYDDFGKPIPNQKLVTRQGNATYN
jgi:hypothetical protein